MITLLLSAPHALACGGFFCNNIPVDQSGEDILFVADEVQDETTVHVQIAYRGEASDFAWIVPVAGEPEIELSTDTVFRELGIRTDPRFEVEMALGACHPFSSSVYDMPDVVPPPSPPGLSVVSEGAVGPYDTVVLRARDSGELLQWLQEHGYDLPSGLEPVLAPYVAEGSHFVALRLSQGESVGALQPIALRYAGTGMSIPLQLTSIAATDDMPVRAYVLASARAVPDSYLHVTLDALSLGWWRGFWFLDWDRGNDVYDEVVRQAVDEAGGHAFATDYAGSSAFMDKVLWTRERYDLERLAKATPFELMDVLSDMGLAGEPLLLPMFMEFLPMPEALVQQGVSVTGFYNCLECFPRLVDEIPFDAAAFAARVDERIIEPRRELQLALSQHPWLTRMSTALSPAEMTLDPTFVLNRDLPQSVGPGIARLETTCVETEEPTDWRSAPLRFVLPDGRGYELPSADYMESQRTSPWQLLSRLVDRYVLTVEDMGAEGLPTVLVDFRAEAQAEADTWNETHDWTLDEEPVSPVDPPTRVTAEVAGCGCASPSRPSRALIATMLLAVLSLRRRRA